MNLPNKLTVLRVVMIPLFLVLFFWRSLPHNYLLALLVFALAAITDLLDGKIARNRGLVTDFGKLMDPLADKLLVMAAMVCFVSAGLTHAAVVVVILAREFLVTSIRLVAASGGKVIAADIWGKIKTVCQMIWLCYGLLLLWIIHNLGWYDLSAAGSDGVWLYLINTVMTALVLVFTVFSGWNYTWNNRKLFADA